MISSIHFNQAAVSGQRYLYNNIQSLNSSQEKLSSGKRINHAADDAAGLAISEKLKIQINGIRQANKNIQDGISLLQVAEGSMETASDMLQRLRVLVIQGANDTLTNSDRALLQKEVDQILYEMNRMAGTANFNGIYTNGPGTETGTEDVAIVGTSYYDDGAAGPATTFDDDGDGTSDWTQTEYDELVTNVKNWVESGMRQAYGMTGWGNISNDDITITFYENDAAMVADGKNAAVASANNTTLNINLEYFIGNKTNQMPGSQQMVIAHEMTHSMMYRAGVSSADIPNNAGAVADQDGWIVEGSAEWASWGGFYRLYGGTNPIDDTIHGEGTSTFGADDYAQSYAAFKFIEENWGNERISNILNDIKNGTSAATSIVNRFSEYDTIDEFNTAADTWIDNYVTEDAFFSEMEKQGLGYIHTGEMPIKQSKINIATGADVDNNFDFFTFNTTAAGLGYVNFVDVSTNAMSEESLYSIDQSINILSKGRAELGAVMNRLEHSLNANGIMLENLMSSNSRIADTDFAEEMVKYSKNQILTQASQSILSQANFNSQNILTLLGSI